jgi:hypothetical protein
VIKKWIVEHTAHYLIALFWAVGDWLFDHFVNVAGAIEWREWTAKKIAKSIDRNDAWQPKSKLGHVWKENRRQMHMTQCALMGFAYPPTQD